MSHLRRALQMGQHGRFFQPESAPKIPLRLLLIVPFVLQVIGVVGVTGWLSLRNGQRSAHDLAQQLREGMTEHVQHNIEDLLNTAETINELTLKNIDTDSLNLGEIRSLEDRYWNYLTTYETINGLGVGNSDGEIMGLFKQKTNDETTYYLEYSSSETNGDYISIELDSQRRIVGSTRFDRDVDARERPWYEAAQRAGEPIWTDVYTSISKSKQYALLTNYSRPVFSSEGQLQGVISVILDLSQISDFLSALDLPPAAEVYVIQPTGELIGTSDGWVPIGWSEGVGSRLKASDSRTPLIRASAVYLSQLFEDDLSTIQDIQQLQFSIDGERQFLQISPFVEGYGIDWLTVVVMPEATFMEQVYAGTRNTLFLCLGALVLAILLGTITSQWIARPIARLTRAASRLSEGDFDQRIGDHQGVTEISILATSFNRMAHNLQESFAALRESESRLRMALQAGEILCWEQDLNTGRVRCFGKHTQEGWQALAWQASSEEMYEGIHPDDRHQLRAAMAMAATQSAEIDIEHRILLPNQHVIWVLALGRRIPDQAGNSERLVGVSLNISERKRAETQLQNLISGTAATTGQDFFPALVRHIANALDVSHAIVAEQVDGDLRSLAFWADESLQPNVSYHPARTPCGRTLLEGTFCCEDALPQRFPHLPDHLALALAGLESYLGIAMRNSKGQTIGNLCVLNRRPIPDPQRAAQILKVFADRAAAELERQRAITSLESLNQELETIVEARTAALREREARYRGLLDGASDAILVVDLQGNVVEVNRRAEDVFGYPRQQMVLMHQFQLYPSEDVESIAMAFLEVVEGKRTQIPDVRVLHQEGRTVPVDISATVVEIDSVPFVHIIFHNISDRKQLELDMLQNMKELQRLNTVKDDFLSTVSHELRTPLTSISMASYMLKVSLEQQQIIGADPTPESERLGRYLSILQDQCKEEEDLINDLLDLQRLNADAYALDFTQIRLQDWIESIIQGFRERACQQDQRFEVEIVPNMPPLVTDAMALRRILTELLNNACKYTPAGEQIRLLVTHHPCIDPPDSVGEISSVPQIQFDISNTGVEIGPEEQARLFEPFYRAVKEDRWSKRGTGLGLTLVKKFLERLNGSISVESGSNRTCFRVVLPAVAVSICPSG